MTLGNSYACRLGQVIALLSTRSPTWDEAALSLLLPTRPGRGRGTFVPGSGLAAPHQFPLIQWRRRRAHTLQGQSCDGSLPEGIEPPAWRPWPRGDARDEVIDDDQNDLGRPGSCHLL